MNAAERAGRSVLERSQRAGSGNLFRRPAEVTSFDSATATCTCSYDGVALAGPIYTGNRTLSVGQQVVLLIGQGFTIVEHAHLPLP